MSVETVLRTRADRDLNEDSSMERKTWQVYTFGKRNVFRLHESRHVCVCVCVCVCVYVCAVSYTHLTLPTRR